MRILFVDPILYTVESGNVHRVPSVDDTLVHQMCRTLEEQGHRVTMVAAEDYKPTGQTEFPYQARFLRTAFRKLFPPRSFPFMPALLPFLARHGREFDAIVCGEVFGLHSLACVLICPHKTVVWHELALHPRVLGGWASRVWYFATAPFFARAKAIVARSENAKAFLAARGFRNIATEIVRHGVDLSKFPASAEKLDQFVVVSQLVPRKRVDQTLRVFASWVASSGAKSTLLIAGDGPIRSDLEQLASSLGLGERVRFLGRVSHEDLSIHLRLSRALLYSGYKDNSLLTVSETIACGTPVVVTREIDNADLVERLGLGIAQDEWDRRELDALVAGQETFIRSCMIHRGECDQAVQCARLVDVCAGGDVRGTRIELPARRKRPRLAILSQNCFAFCDLTILPELRRGFDIDWTVFFPHSDNLGHSETELEELAQSWGVRHRIVRLGGRLRSLGTLRQFISIAIAIRKGEPDIVYVNATGSPWLAPVLKLVLGRRKVLWAIHDVQDHRNKSRWSLDALYKRAIAAMFGAYHLLSRNQIDLFRSLHPRKIALHAPLPPLNYGVRQGQPSADRTVFLFFGYLDHYKGVDLLIEAAQLVMEEGAPPFEVVMAGRTEDWSRFSAGIRAPDLFRLDIRMIPNERIPYLYGEAHWLVLPYRDATQSGPLALAFEYEIPVIASDLPAFREFVPEGTGILFTAGRVDALAAALRKALAMDKDRRCEMIQAQQDMYHKNYALAASVRHYSNMFHEFLGVHDGGRRG